MSYTNCSKPCCLAQCVPRFYYRARVSLAGLFSHVIPNFADGQFSTVSGLSRNGKELGELIVLRAIRAIRAMPEPPCVCSAHQNSPIGYPQHVGASFVCDTLITHANPGNPQNVSNSAVPELVNEMARSLGEGSVLASIKQCGADANKEKSPLDVPLQFARKPNRLQSSMYLRGFCNSPRYIF